MYMFEMYKVNLGLISGISPMYVRYISGISQIYLKSNVKNQKYEIYLGYIQEYFKYTLCISYVNLRHILGILQVFLRCITGRSQLFHWYILGIS